MSVAHFEADQAALPGIEQLRKSHPRDRDVNVEFEHGFSRLERIAIWITDHVGTMGFFFIIAVWTIVWLGWNLLAPPELRFDPGPAFVLWLFISNLLQLHLMPLIMVGQNLQDRYAELRAEADFAINQKAEREVETILAHLAHQNDLILEVLRRVERIERARTV
jgi:uncharacterized membrane protein